MNIIKQIQASTAAAVQQLYGLDAFVESDIAVSPTRKEFEGDYTVVVFPFVKAAKKKPADLAHELGDYLLQQFNIIKKFNVIQGFLNLSLSDEYWKSIIRNARTDNYLDPKPAHRKKVMVEFASPNTNKPLHLGHIRNILLGDSMARILSATGNEVVRTQIINDRGIAICKSMIAWQYFAEGLTPAEANLKGDHFVGEQYVRFEKEFQNEYKLWQQSPEGQGVFLAWKSDEQQLARAKKRLEEQGQLDLLGNEENVTIILEKYFFKEYKNNYFNEHSTLGRAAKEMLLRWEEGDADTIALWKKMNNWVYEGFDVTYQRLGVSFDSLYYESNTYLLGKDIIEKGLEKGVFYRKDDGSVWIDLEDVGMDQKLVLRSDGTSVYITQDIGTAQLRYTQHAFDKMAYVVADEQNYHFQALFETLKKLGEPYANGLYHLSYGMVNLPEGRMKSREGTVVDADDLMDEVIAEARASVGEGSTLLSLDAAAQQDAFRQIGLAALKYFMLKVNPKKTMIFDPKESVDLQGQTGPYIQYSCVRIKSVLEKASKETDGLSNNEDEYETLLPLERELAMQLYSFSDVLEAAADEYDPSTLANYAYVLAKNFHRFWNEAPIIRAETPQARTFRLGLCQAVGKVLNQSLELLGIEVPNRM